MHVATQSTPAGSVRAFGRFVARGVLDLLLPRACLLCERQMATQRMICDNCWRGVAVLPRPTCERCGHPSYGEACQWCVLLPGYVTSCRSVCWVPEGAGGEIVHRLKYDGWTRLGAEMAARIDRVARVASRVHDTVVVPVPLGAKRLRERGYNQSKVIADALAGMWGVPAAPRAVMRVRDTQSQVRLTPGERSANVQSAFAAGEAADAVRGRHVVLVDDVVTTAATLNACAAAAIAAGARTLSYVTFGRARAAFDRGGQRRSA